MGTSQSTEIDSLKSLGSQWENAEEGVIILLHLPPSAAHHWSLFVNMHKSKAIPFESNISFSCKYGVRW